MPLGQAARALVETLPGPGKPEAFLFPSFAHGKGDYRLRDCWRAVCEDATDFADASALPDPSTLYDHVYAEINPHGRLFLDGRGHAGGIGGQAPAGGSRTGGSHG